MELNRFYISRKPKPTDRSVCISLYRKDPSKELDGVVLYNLDLIRLKGRHVVFVYFSPQSESYDKWMYKRALFIAILGGKDHG